MTTKKTKDEEYFLDSKETNLKKFIFGIKSPDDISSSTEASLFTMNDLDLIYLKDEGKYSLGIETIYDFVVEDTKYNYILWLLNKFTKFMYENGYDTHKELELYDVFTKGININTKFDSIEECYATFRLLVCGFLDQQNNK